MGDQIEQAAKSEEINPSDTESLKEIKALFIEAVAGAAMFIVIAGFAVGLGFFVSLLKSIDVDPVIIYGLTAFEYFLFTVDLFLAVVFICKKVILYTRGGNK